jgi:hypothetical protein
MNPLHLPADLVISTAPSPVELPSVGCAESVVSMETGPSPGALTSSALIVPGADILRLELECSD